MPQLLKDNAYHILGLDTFAEQKDILKRSKEIINRLKVDDNPEYSADIGVYKDFRTETSAKEAAQRLQIPKKKIEDYFFWFRIADSIDEDALAEIRKKNVEKAIKIWSDVSDGSTTKGYFYKKNLAILYCVLLSIEDNKQYLLESLKAWQEIVYSEKFWSAFSKVYKLHNEQIASQEIIDDFRKRVIGDLSDIYTDLYQTHESDQYLNEFQKVFSAKGREIEKSVLNPAYQSINDAVVKLEEMKVSKDDVFDKDESELIKKLVGIIQSELNKLIDLGLYDDSQTQVMRDRAANALRGIVLDLHNNLNEYDRSKKLLEVAIQMCGTDSLKNKLRNELEQIEKNIIDDTENSLALDIPGYAGATLVFKNNYLVYGGKKVFYKDVISISYHSTKHTTSVYFVPVSTRYTYSLSIISPSENISFSLSAGGDDSSEKDVWAKSAGLIGHMIEPLLVKKFVDQIFDKGETVKIASVEFDKDGYSITRTKFFGGKVKESVPWDENVYTPKFASGEVVLFKHAEDKGVQFTTVSMSSENAVIIPELVKACTQRVLSAK